MKKIPLACIFLVMSLLQPCPQVAHAQDVEAFVQDFYKWYLKQSLSFVKQHHAFEDLPVLMKPYSNTCADVQPSEFSLIIIGA